jgi:hypothetical protein
MVLRQQTQDGNQHSDIQGKTSVMKLHACSNEGRQAQRMLLVMSHHQLGVWRSGWATLLVHVLWLLVLLPIKISTAAIARGQVLGIYVLQQLASIAACTTHKILSTVASASVGRGQPAIGLTLPKHKQTCVATDTHSEEQMAIFSCVDLGMNTCVRIAP